ncbi:hypothetical protein [Clostridium intestinale]|uniref:hypothetical protein n=1 Tax=Clostridium intestinale TaxID=36845 RepID=UPI0028E4C9E7|nr:hypothetical protein [Clostridium intestinale]
MYTYFLKGNSIACHFDSFKTSEDKKAFRELLEEKTSLKAKYEYPDGLKYI